MFLIAIINSKLSTMPSHLNASNGILWFVCIIHDKVANTFSLQLNVFLIARNPFFGFFHRHFHLSKVFYGNKKLVVPTENTAIPRWIDKYALLYVSTLFSHSFRVTERVFIASHNERKKISVFYFIRLEKCQRKVTTILRHLKVISVTIERLVESSFSGCW